jgi:hypothetical protein
MESVEANTVHTPVEAYYRDALYSFPPALAHLSGRAASRPIDIGFYCTMSCGDVKTDYVCPLHKIA